MERPSPEPEPFRDPAAPTRATPTPELPVTLERYVRLIAGTFVLVSLALGAPASPVFVNANWLWFTAFVGANLAQSSVTGFCPLVNVLKAVGVKSAGEAA
jgi:hypothetical protein